MARKIVVILLGHPGVGKGTQAKEIMRALNIPQISTGDILRDAIEQKTAYGLAAKGPADAGRLVSDEIVNGIVTERIRLDDCAKGFILDGYPRNVPQAEMFSTKMKNDDHLFVIEIGADSSQLIGRLIGRLLCPNKECGEIYNIYSRTPKVEGVCDRCGSDLIHRSDDHEDLIGERSRTYREDTYPLVEFYKRQGVFHQVNGVRPVEDVTRNLLEILTHEDVLAPAPTKGRK